MVQIKVIINQAHRNNKLEQMYNNNKDKFNCNTLLHLLNVTTSEIGPEMGPEIGLEIVGPDDRYR